MWGCLERPLSVAQGTLAGGCPQVPIRRKIFPERKCKINMTGLILIKFDKKLFYIQEARANFSIVAWRGRSKTSGEHSSLSLAPGLVELLPQAIHTEANFLGLLSAQAPKCLSTRFLNRRCSRRWSWFSRAAVQSVEERSGFRSHPTSSIYHLLARMVVPEEAAVGL